MIEFLVAMVFMIPMLMGVIYIFKYADIKQSAIQASRYAAFQRVMQPDDAQLATDAIQDQLRARFFMHGGRGQGDPHREIRSADSASGASPGSDPVLWRDLSSQALLPHFDRVTLNYAEQAFSSAVQTTSAWMHSTFRIAAPRIHVAHVEVSVGDRLHDTHPTLVIAASTALSADSAHAQGSAGVRAALRGHPVLGAVTTAVGWVEPVIQGLVGLFERQRPELSCLKVESVPADRLSGPGSAGACQ